MSSTVNVEEYINSGILESYVLGLTSKDESANVEKMATKHPEVQEQINAIREAMDEYAKEYAKEPPAGLKDQIWNEINSGNAERDNVIQMPGIEQPKANKSWMVAASIGLLLISLAVNYSLYDRLTDAKQQIAELNAEKDLLASEYQVQQTEFEQLSSEIAFISQPNVRAVSMTGVAEYPDDLATVYWNTETSEVYLSVNSLAEPPADKQYQLWAIVDGVPVDAGVFECCSNLQGIQKMISFKDADAFAVTLEKAGGNPTPEGPRIVIGEV